MNDEKRRQDLRLRTKLLADSGTVKPGRLSELLGEADELMAIFSSIIKSTRAGASYLIPHN